jgi:UDP-glucose 4-epimerase
MKVFITGIESFVGTYLSETFKKKRYSVFGIDKKKSKASTVKFDITNKNLYRIIPQNCDCLVHLAAVSTAESFNRNLLNSFNINVNGTLNVVQSAIRKKVKQVIFASTEWIYGEEKNFNIKNENSNILLKKISSNYAFSKILGEQIIEYYSYKSNINFTILRFGIIYGPRFNNQNFSAVETIISDMILNKKLVIGSKKTARRFIYITDICEAIFKSVGIKGFKKFNLTGEKLINLGKIYRTGKKILNFKKNLFEVNKNKYNIRNISNKKFKEYTKWETKIDITEGVKNIINEFNISDKK